MTTKELQVRALFKKMLKDTEEFAKSDEYYAEDMKDYAAKVQWRFGHIRGYQIFKGVEYSFKIDEEIENPDFILECDDLDLAKRFLNDEIEYWPDLAKTDLQVTWRNSDGSIERASVGDVTGFSPTTALSRDTKLTMRLVVILPFRRISERTSDPKHSTDVRIPINKSLGTYQNQIMPLAVVEYFINKASHVFLMDVCPCRVVNNCQNYDHYKFGCMSLGRGVLRMEPWSPGPAATEEELLEQGWKAIEAGLVLGHIATKEEALERARGAIEAGLIPSLGRVKGDSIIYNALPDNGDLFHLCYCCPCCCVEAGIKKATKYFRSWHVRMEGLSVTVDSKLCKGCGKCLEVCIYDGRKIIDGKAVVDQERCLGCGRCERVCPNGAINITLEEDGVERMLARIETYVDVT